VHEQFPGQDLAQVIFILILIQLTLKRDDKIGLSEKVTGCGPRPNAYQKGPEATSRCN